MEYLQIGIAIVIKLLRALFEKLIVLGQNVKQETVGITQGII